jgi:hypothetical protein
MAFSGFNSFTADFGLSFYLIKRKPTRKRLTKISLSARSTNLQAIS